MERFRIVFGDTETTTSGSNARMIQLALKERGNDGTVINESFQPTDGSLIDIDAMAIHHITPQMLEGKVTFQQSDVRGQVVELLKGALFVAHQAPFDRAVLQKEGVEVGQVIDTFRVAKHLVDYHSHSLQKMRYLLELNVVAQAHDALGDVLVLEALFERLLEQVKVKYDYEDEQLAIQKMIDLSEEPALLKKLAFGKYMGRRFEEIVEEDLDYLRWMQQSQMKKEEEKRNTDLVLTLEHYLGEYIAPEPAEERDWLG